MSALFYFLAVIILLKIKNVNFASLIHIRIVNKLHLTISTEKHPMSIRHFLFTFACLLGFALSANAQQKHLSFTAVAQNVDGLPKSISGVSVNEDGQEGPGATALGNAIVKQGWDIVGMSEDFNFHSELTTPLSGLYQVGTHGGTVSAGAILGGADTDGLGLLLANRPGASFANETRVAWTTYNGFTDQGADGLVSKGFRYYAVTLGEGFVVDVYVLHMDADSGEKDIAARTTQLKQLATYIKGHNNNRPIIIIGDTNCRYTRDSLQEDLINSINSVSGMTIKDAWIELVRGGIYPAVGDNALMIDALGNRKGEVVDKIFYINIAGAPLQITANTYELAQPEGWPSDHWPVIVNFTLTNTTVADETTEGLADRWTVDAPAAAEYEVQGCQVESGKTYYFMNVGSKKYIKFGGRWSAQAVEGSAGTPITIEGSGTNYGLKTISGYMFLDGAALTYMDGGENTSWTFQEVTGKQYQYYIKYTDGKALASTGEVATSNTGIVNTVTFN